MSPTDKRVARALQDAPKIVSATVALMEELIRLLGQEVEVVAARKMSEHTELLKHKQKLAVDYRANMKSIAAQPDLIKKLPDDAKAIIREMARKLADAADNNACTLKAAVEATRQLIQNVVAMIRSETMPKKAYKNLARAHLQLGTYSPTCQPITGSRTV